MGSRKSKRCGTGKGPMEVTQSDSRSVFEALLYAIHSPPEGLSSAILKRLYFVLNHLWSNPQCEADEFQLHMELGSDGIKVTIKDIQRLSDVLSEELSLRFKDFCDALCKDYSDKDLGNEMWAAAEILNLLLRCCLVVLPLLQCQQKFLLEKGQVVLGILRNLSSVNLNVRKRRRRGRALRFERSVSVACESDTDCTTLTEDFVASLCFLEPSDSRITLVTAILEVFLDELLVCGQLRPLFSIVESFAARTCYSRDDLGQLTEIICNHFCLSFSDECLVEDFLGRLFCVRPKEYGYLRAIELSPTAGTLLLLNPIILSAPKFIRAHVIALVSEATIIAMDFKSWKPDSRLMNCLLSAFESSVGFYKSNMVRWKIYENHRSAKGSYKSNMHVDTGHQSFDSFLSPHTREKINSVISNLEGSSESCLRNLSNKMKPDLMSSAIWYVKECQYIFDDACQDEMLSILSCILQRASDGLDDTVSFSIGLGNLEDLCLLASILRLMGNSLLQVIWFLRHDGDTHGLKSLRDFTLCKEYDSVLRTISFFTEFKVHVPIKKLQYNIMEENCTRHSRSRMMLLHLLGLLSYSFTTGLDFLLKGCLWNIISLLNLIVFEEGNLLTLHSFLSSNSESVPSNFPSVSIQETVLTQNSSLMVASKIQKMRALYSRTSLDDQLTRLANGYSQTGSNAIVPGDTVGAVGTEEEIEEASNGELFLRCMLRKSDKISDFDDLADFIECKQGKDYSSWLKDREKFRKWKGEKMEVLRWKRKKKTWKEVKSKKT